MTALGPVKRLSSLVTQSDKRMNALIRQSPLRNNWKVTPGVYAVGNPNDMSDVFVTGNYKTSVDFLRGSVPGNSWIIVLDTHGINVWCAAGKGTFGTQEVVRLIEKCSLKELVSHRRIILPQLGAPGVSAFEVKQKTGFTVVYGPVRAEDINTFVTAGYKASKDMRRVRFELGERMILTPLEFIQSLKFTAVAVVLFVCLAIAGKYDFTDTSWISQLLVWGVSISFFGSVLFPAALPALKGNWFTVRAIPISAVWAVGTFAWVTRSGSSYFEAAGMCLIGAALIEYYALNFTGATPITSYTETTNETLKVLPILIGVAVVGGLVYGLAMLQVGI